MVLAAEAVKPVLMELGGHAPSRFLVHSSKYEGFVESITAKVAKLKVGDGFEEGVQMGPLVNSRRMQVVTELVDDAVANGARLVTGGHRIGNRGWFYAPTVLADVPLHAMVMHEEPFGPIAPCLPVDSMDEALAISNSLSTGHAP